MIGLKKATSSRSLFEAGRRGPTYKLPRGHYFYPIAPLNLSLFDIWALANPIPTFCASWSLEGLRIFLLDGDHVLKILLMITYNVCTVV